MSTVPTRLPKWLAHSELGIRTNDESVRQYCTYAPAVLPLVFSYKIYRTHMEET